MIKQLRSLDKEHTTSYQKLLNDSKKSFESLRKEKDSSIKLLKRRIHEKDQDLENVKKEYLKKVEKISKEKDQKIDKITKQSRQHQHFYRISLSKKEILEDRIHNWERALMILSNHILGERSNAKNDIAKKVAKALSVVHKRPFKEQQLPQHEQSSPIS